VSGTATRDSCKHELLPRLPFRRAAHGQGAYGSIIDRAVFITPLTDHGWQSGRTCGWLGQRVGSSPGRRRHPDPAGAQATAPSGAPRSASGAGIWVVVRVWPRAHTGGTHHGARNPTRDAPAGAPLSDSGAPMWVPLRDWPLPFPRRWRGRSAKSPATAIRAGPLGSAQRSGSAGPELPLPSMHHIFLMIGKCTLGDDVSSLGDTAFFSVHPDKDGPIAQREPIKAPLCVSTHHHRRHRRSFGRCECVACRASLRSEHSWP
jgi:hypothetical protein